MHTILIDTAPAAGGSWQQVLSASVMPKLSRWLRLAEIAQQEPLRQDAQAAWLTPAERWMCMALGLREHSSAEKQAGMTSESARGQLTEAPTGERAPWGALAARGAGVDPRGLPWGIALPVHLELGRESLHLADPAFLKLTRDEANALLGAVQPLLEDAEWIIDIRDPGCWLVAHPSLTNVVTADPGRAIGRNVASWMPAGTEARPWRQLLTEIQMVWQHHPVNEARMRAGQPEANLLWLHGCGRLPDDLRSPFLPLGAAQVHDTAWWRAARAGFNKLPPTRHPHALQVLQPSVTRQADAVELRNSIAALDQDAAQAVDLALRDHNGAKVILAGERRWIAFELARARRWQFWRRADAHVLLGLV